MKTDIFRLKYNETNDLKEKTKIERYVMYATTMEKSENSTINRLTMFRYRTNSTYVQNRSEHNVVI